MTPEKSSKKGNRLGSGKKFAGVFSLMAAMTLLIGFFFPPVQWVFMLVAFAILIASFFVATIFGNE